MPFRTVEYYGSARDAFRDYLLRTNAPRRGAVLLPAYIGWSSREGSGVFDPIREAGARYRFYRMTRDLRIDVADAERQMDAGDVSVFVLIHYFGWPDPEVAQLANAARQRGIPVVEDEAHAMLTDVVGGVAGRDGDVSLYSLHKMLPIREGGMLVWNATPIGAPERVREASALSSFDVALMARRRVENGQLVRELLKPLAGRVDPLWSDTPLGVVPQTFPVVVQSVDRTQLYHAMNAAGYGVVSLYHTMIDEITRDEYPDSHWLAQRIMNLPVHPDATRETMSALVTELEARTRV